MSNKYDDNYDNYDDVYDVYTRMMKDDDDIASLEEQIKYLQYKIKCLEEREEFLQHENDVRQLMLALTLDDMRDVFGILKVPADRAQYIGSIRAHAEKQIEQLKRL